MTYPVRSSQATMKPVTKQAKDSIGYFDLRGATEVFRDRAEFCLTAHEVLDAVRLNRLGRRFRSSTPGLLPREFSPRAGIQLERITQCVDRRTSRTIAHATLDVADAADTDA